MLLLYVVIGINLTNEPGSPGQAAAPPSSSPSGAISESCKMVSAIRIQVIARATGKSLYKNL
jgi:hypothetical protein